MQFSLIESIRIYLEIDIAIIAIDDKSIAKLGRFPWTRTEYARLIKKLSEAGAKAVSSI